MAAVPPEAFATQWEVATLQLQRATSPAHPGPHNPQHLEAGKTALLNPSPLSPSPLRRREGIDGWLLAT